MSTQRHLFEHDSRVERAFEEWLTTEDGKTVLRLATDRARRLLASGWEHYGIKAIIESMRFDQDLLLGPDADGYKLNNNHTAYLAREIMEKCPDLRGFFETRVLHGR